MKFKLTIILCSVVFSSSLVLAGISGGGGGFPTDGSIINVDDSNLVLNPSDLINDWSILLDDRGGFSELKNRMPDLLDLTNTTLDGDTIKINFDGFTKLKIVPADHNKLDNTVSRLDVSNSLSQISNYTPSIKIRAQYKKYAKKVKEGDIDLIFVTDEEDKIILMDSSKIK